MHCTLYAVRESTFIHQPTMSVNIKLYTYCAWTITHLRALFKLNPRINKENIGDKESDIAHGCQLGDGWTTSAVCSVHFTLVLAENWSTRSNLSLLQDNNILLKHYFGLVNAIYKHCRCCGAREYFNLKINFIDLVWG